jgi:hypothetical protein
VWLRGPSGPVAKIVRIGISDGARTEVAEGDVAPGDLAIVEATSEAVKKRP